MSNATPSYVAVPGPRPIVNVIVSLTTTEATAARASIGCARLHSYTPSQGVAFEDGRGHRTDLIVAREWLGEVLGSLDREAARLNGAPMRATLRRVARKLRKQLAQIQETEAFRAQRARSAAAQADAATVDAATADAAAAQAIVDASLVTDAQAAAVAAVDVPAYVAADALFAARERGVAAAAREYAADETLRAVEARREAADFSTDTAKVWVAELLLAGDAAVEAAAARQAAYAEIGALVVAQADAQCAQVDATCRTSAEADAVAGIGTKSADAGYAALDVDVADAASARAIGIDARYAAAQQSADACRVAANASRATGDFVAADRMQSAADEAQAVANRIAADDRTAADDRAAIDARAAEAIAADSIGTQEDEAREVAGDVQTQAQAACGESEIHGEACPARNGGRCTCGLDRKGREVRTQESLDRQAAAAARVRVKRDARLAERTGITALQVAANRAATAVTEANDADRPAAYAVLDAATCAVAEEMRDRLYSTASGTRSDPPVEIGAEIVGVDVGNGETEYRIPARTERRSDAEWKAKHSAEESARWTEITRTAPHWYRLLRHLQTLGAQFQVDECEASETRTVRTTCEMLYQVGGATVEVTYPHAVGHKRDGILIIPSNGWCAVSDFSCSGPVETWCDANDAEE